MAAGQWRVSSTTRDEDDCITTFRTTRRRALKHAASGWARLEGAVRLGNDQGRVVNSSFRIRHHDRTCSRHTSNKVAMARRIRNQACLPHILMGSSRVGSEPVSQAPGSTTPRTRRHPWDTNNPPAGSPCVMLLDNAIRRFVSRLPETSAAFPAMRQVQRDGCKIEAC